MPYATSDELNSVTTLQLLMRKPASIHYFNRYTQRLETEQVYGAGWMRWTYGNPFGRLALELFIKRPFFSRWYGWRMNRPASARKIRPFIRTYELNVAEFADPPYSFRTFNEFFYRRLRPDARPVDPDPNAVVFPADARHLGFSDASQIDGVFVKGQKFNLARLLGDAELANRYARATVVLSRLCPVDYHRFHFPVSGKASETISAKRPALFRKPHRAPPQSGLPLGKSAHAHDGEHRIIRHRADAGNRRHQCRLHPADISPGPDCERRRERLFRVRRELNAAAV
jgi:hypothetical protein